MATYGYLCRKCDVPFEDIATRNSHESRCRKVKEEVIGQSASPRAERFMDVLRTVIKDDDRKEVQVARA